MADDLALETEDLGSYTIVRANGYLDVSTAPRLRELLTGIADRKAATIVLLDLGTIEFLDSSALGVILNGWKLLQAGGGRLAVVSPQERITKIFEITALTLSINLFASMEEARASLGL